MTRDEAIEYLARIPDGEPVFVFRAQDTFAPGTVSTWAALCLSQNEVDKDHLPLHPETLAKGSRAMSLANEMREWQRTHSHKMPD